MRVRVYYEDTDAGGIVYHTNYLKYCERARSEIFFLNGLKPFESNNSGFVVRKAVCDFLGMATLGDTLDVYTKVKTLKRSSLLLNQWIEKENSKIFSMEVLLVYIKDGKISKIPPTLKGVIEKMG